MLTEFLVTVDPESVRTRAVDLARSGRPMDVDDAWKLGVLLADAGFISDGAQVLQAVIESDPTHTEAVVDLGQLQLMQGDSAGSEMLEKSLLPPEGDDTLGARDLLLFYDWSRRHDVLTPVAAGDERRLERDVRRWWESSERRTDLDRLDHERAAEERMTRTRWVRAWMRAASPAEREEYSRLSEAIADLPKKSSSSTSREGGKITFRGGFSPEFVALLKQRADLLNGSPAVPGESTARARGQIEYLAVTTADADQILDGIRSLCDDPVGVEFVIFEGARGFVQFAPAGLFGLLGEAVSNAFLDPDVALTDVEHDGLLAIGWEDAAADGNYSLEWKEPVDLTQITSVVRSTFGLYGDRLDEVRLVLPNA